MSRSRRKATKRSVVRRLATASLFRVLQPLMEPTKSARASQFEAVPTTEGAVVFLGDSITEGGLWDEWFPTVRVVNRGIGGNTTSEIRRRLQASIDSPAAVFLLCGTNDISRGVARCLIVDEIKGILDAILQHSPATRIYLHSVMPRAAAFHDELVSLNQQLRRLADSQPDTIEYVDLWPVLADPDGALRKDLTVDSLHLNGRGYAAWTSLIRPLVSRYAADRTQQPTTPQPADQLDRPQASGHYDAFPRSTDA